MTFRNIAGIITAFFLSLFNITPDSPDADFITKLEISTLVNQRELLISDNRISDKTEQINEINSAIIQLNQYDFTDKKITFIGDSVTYGTGGRVKVHPHGVITPISYVYYMKGFLDFDYTNLGLAGSTIGSYGDFPIIERMDTIPEDSDIIFFFAGANDFFEGPDYFGDSSLEAGTYTGDTATVFENLSTNYPDSDIYVVLLYNSYYEYLSYYLDYGTLYKYLSVQKELANQYGFNIIELYNTGFMSSLESKTKNTYFKDGIHPNNQGYYSLALYFAARLVEDYN